MKTTVTRYAWEDQFPPGTDLEQAARDSVIRYANHFGIPVDMANTREFWGERWRRVDVPGREWPAFWMPGMAPTGVHGVRVTAPVFAGMMEG